MRHLLASIRSASPPGPANTPSSTASPSGNAALSSARTTSGSMWSTSWISTYYASLAAPVGAAPTQETFGCGLYPCE